MTGTGTEGQAGHAHPAWPMLERGAIPTPIYGMKGKSSYRSPSRDWGVSREVCNDPSLDLVASPHADPAHHTGNRRVRRGPTRGRLLHGPRAHGARGRSPHALPE